MTTSTGYFRYPTVHGDRVVFVSEDDLWEVPLQGGIARRLTSGLGEAAHPVFSPDGSMIAFTGTEEGRPEVFVMDAAGGAPKRRTFQGTQCATVGWTPDGKSVVYRTNHGQAFRRNVTLFSVPFLEGEARDMGFGPAHNVCWQPGATNARRGVALTRNADDLARWKRYRGGTAGVLWVDAQGTGGWERLFRKQTAGIVRPLWIGERIWFVSDEEGTGNLYSCLPDGSDRTQHTAHEGFYVRWPSSDGETIVYACGGSLWRLDPAGGEAQEIAVDYASPRTQLQRKFVDAADYLDDVDLHPRGHSLAVTTRGKAFNFGNWEGAVRQTGEEQGVRYRLATWLDDGERILYVSDAGGEEHFELHRADGPWAPWPIEVQGGLDIGRPLELKVSPADDEIAFTNHRHELIWLRLEDGAARVLDRSAYERIQGFDWSPDGRWIVYSLDDSHRTSKLRLVGVADDNSGEPHDLTTGEFRDVEPCFDPDGRYIYFLSHRYFEPVYDQLFFEIGFPKSMRPCLLTLGEDVESPFVEKPRPLDADEDDGDEEESSEEESGDEESSAEEESSDEEEREEPLQIDLEGISRRIEAFPVPTADYGRIQATRERVFWTVFPTETPEGKDWQTTPSGRLEYFDLKKRRRKGFAPDVEDFFIGPDGKTMLLISDGLRVVSAAGEGPGEDDDDEPGRKSGWIDLERIAVSVEVRPEWRQMLREAWRLMRDHFWRADMAGNDWDEVWQRYSPLVERCASRSEFSDLVWAMQGELGTSHAYELGGDYRMPPQYAPGFLGADVAWDEGFDHNGIKGAYRIERIVQGDTWDRDASSPLARPGVGVREGDYIVALNSRPLHAGVSPQQRLVHQAGKEVDLMVVDAESKERRVKTVRTLRSEFPARYRDWVEKNRAAVHEATEGRIGYLHVPDMSIAGFAEFHRGYLTELRRDGVIVDVRNNGGGHVSQLLLEKLARQRLGYDVGRWGVPRSYPDDSIAGPLVALTDEHAGSDGDIFSHCFKLMNLGPLVGKRTWGGVVGIWPRHRLVDGSMTTQPEFSFWFEDVGFGVENYGTEPDIEVEIPPQAGEGDPQLDAAIATAVQLLELDPPKLPSFE